MDMHVCFVWVELIELEGPGLLHFYCCRKLSLTIIRRFACMHTHTHTFVHRCLYTRNVTFYYRKEGVTSSVDAQGRDVDVSASLGQNDNVSI